MSLAKRLTRKVWLTAAIAMVMIGSLPLLWLALGAFKTVAELWAYPPVFFPKHPTLSNFRGVLFGGQSRLPYLINSLVISFVTTIITVCLSVPAAYGFSRFRIRGGKHLEFWILSTRMMPPIAAIIPLFLIIRGIGLYDTILAMVLVYVGFNLSYAVWMITIFFRRLNPHIEQAAMIDGCGPFSAFFRIAVPLIFPGIMTVAVFVFTFSWNELIYALVLTGNRAKTLPVGISEYAGGIFYRWELMTAASVIQIIPAVAVVVCMQKYIVSGLTMGAIDK